MVSEGQSRPIEQHETRRCSPATRPACGSVTSADTIWHAGFELFIPWHAMDSAGTGSDRVRKTWH